MIHFADALTARIRETSPVCVGLDPQLQKLPDGISRDVDGVVTFGKGIIDAVADVAAAVKPQLAFFEVLGWQGMKAFWELCTYAKTKNLLVIADGKRNDIGSTCEAYADAYLGALTPVDALTVTPFMGSDGILPFIKRCDDFGKGIFIMVKNSNPSSGELQDLTVGDEMVHEHLAGLVQGWGRESLGSDGRFSNVGAVVGATYPEELKYLRTLMATTPFLIPGYGAQGGTAADVKHGFFADGTGAIVNSSRGILYASDGKDWQEAAQKAAQAMAKELTELFEA